MKNLLSSCCPRPFPACRVALFAALAAVSLTGAASPSRAATYTTTRLHVFKGPGATDGMGPSASLIQGADGNFYGTTIGDFFNTTTGSDAATNGTVFRITPGGTLTTMHAFTGTDGAHPFAPLIQLSNGVFIGTTSGGFNGDGFTIFEIVEGTSGFGFKTLLKGAPKGSQDNVALTLARNGTIYGIQRQGGQINDGSIFTFSLTTNTMTVLHAFNPNEGEFPQGPLVEGTDGNFYGCASGGGAGRDGSIYRITPSGTFTVLHALDSTGDEGVGPVGLVQGKDGNFYGTARQGGDPSYAPVGTFFRVTPAGGFTKLFDLGSQFGVAPSAPLNPRTGPIVGPDGALYGTGSVGGSSGGGYGGIYRFTTGGAYTSVEGFDGASGAYPIGGLVLGKDGNFYGTTSGFATQTNSPGDGVDNYGTVFKVTVSTPAPVITSAKTATAFATRAFSYQVTASNSPTSYGAASLPSGLAINQTTGKISGTPKTVGTYSAVIAAFNSGGSGSAKLTITVKPGPPVVTSAKTASATVGSAFTYQIAATNTPASYGASGLPTGLTINQTTGKITGKPTKSGTYSVTIAAFNAAGSGTAKLTLTVKPGSAAPVITSNLTPGSRQGVAFLYQITATNNPTSYGASGLPTGLSISQSTGKISGTPTKAGTYKVLIAAFNAAGHGSATLTLVVKPPA